MMDDYDVSFIANQMVSENPGITLEDVKKRCACSKQQMKRLKRDGLLPRQITEQHTQRRFVQMAHSAPGRKTPSV